MNRSIGRRHASRTLSAATIATTTILTVVSMPSNGSGSAPGAATEKPTEMATVDSVNVHIVSTMLASRGLGEWGFSALVQADDHSILIDVGHDPDLVLGNARQMGVDLSEVETVVLSHFHPDHTGALLKLRRELMKQNPEALSTIHVGKEFFGSRRTPGDDVERNLMVAVRELVEATGARFVEHEGPTELFRGVWVTGPVPRVHPERNWSGSLEVRTAAGWVEDTVPDSQSLVLNTREGLVVLSGCGHAGIINTLEYARSVIRPAPIHAALGGFHLLEADDEHLEWTASRLRDLGLEHFLGAHCTGIEAVFRIREHAGLTRETCVVGAVGATFSLENGLDPLTLAR